MTGACLAVSGDCNGNWRTPFTVRGRARSSRSTPFPSETGSLASGLPPWYDETSRKLGELEQLEADWDGYGAARISADSIEFARTILARASDVTPAPSIVPVLSGGVQLEWHVASIDFEVEIRDPYSIHLYFEDPNHGIIFDDEISSADLKPLFYAIGVFASRFGGK